MTTLTTPGTATRPAATASPRSRVGWVWIALSSLAIAAFFAGQYLTESLTQLAADNVGLAANYAHRAPLVRVAFYLHVIFGGIALLLGPWQFAARLRRRLPGAHRMIGKGYLVATAAAGTAGLIIAPFNKATVDGFFGFGTLAALWILTAVKAYRSARRRDFASHHAWVIRSFALTYAAVTLRLWAGLLLAVRLPFVDGTITPEAVTTLLDDGYWALPFLCWVPNLVVAEWLIRRRGLPTI